VATAKAYLEFLYKPEAQEILAAHGYRPIDEAILAKHRDLLPEIELFPITILAKSWDDAQYKFFADDGIFDEIYVPKKNN
jgi:sulfate transport system substrate-binding protein